jgi:hypothetical protein
MSNVLDYSLDSPGSANNDVLIMISLFPFTILWLCGFRIFLYSAESLIYIMKIYVGRYYMCLFFPKFSPHQFFSADAAQAVVMLLVFYTPLAITYLIYCIGDYSFMPASSIFGPQLSHVAALGCKATPKDIVHWTHNVRFYSGISEARKIISEDPTKVYNQNSKGIGQKIPTKIESQILGEMSVFIKQYW